MKIQKVIIGFCMLLPLAFTSCDSSDNTPLRSDNTPLQNVPLEYISYKIDNEPVVYLSKLVGYAPVYHYSSQTTTYHYQGNDDLGNYMIFDSDTNIPGVYKNPNFYISETTISDGPKIGDDISFTINKFGNTGEYIDIDFSGNYTGSQSTVHSITGKIHILKD